MSGHILKAACTCGMNKKGRILITFGHFKDEIPYNKKKNHQKEHSAATTHNMWLK